MKPAVTVQIINASLLLVSYLFSQFVFKEVRFMLFLTGFQALLNFAASIVFYMDNKKQDNKLATALLIGGIIMTVVTVILWKFVFVATIHLPELEV